MAGADTSPNLDKSVEVEMRDEEEEDDIDQMGSSPQQSFRKFGIAFLVIAIIVAILTAAVPASLNSHHTITNPRNGILYFAFLIVFLLLLLSCLFSTYFLGGAKDAWEDPVFTGIRLNFTNVTAIIGLFIEFIQVCSFSFHPQANFRGSNNFLHMQYAAVPYIPGKVFSIMYWIMFVMAFSPYIFVVTVRMIIYLINRNRGESEAASFVQKYQQKIYSILWFLVNTIYIPVISTMMGGIDCTFSSNKSSPTWDSEPGVDCLSSKQIGFIVCSMLALIIYYPAASFAQSQTQNISDLKFKPRIIFFFVQGKVVLAGVYVFFTSYKNVYLGVVLGVDVAFLLLNIIAKPCLVQWVNYMRTIFFAVSGWTCVCSFIATSTNNNSDTSFGLLVVGWVVIIVGLSIVFILKEQIEGCVKRNKRNSSNTSTSSINASA